MAKVFISYKYADKHVRQNESSDLVAWHFEILPEKYLTVRDYVTHLTNNVLLDHIHKSEKEDEDLSHLTEEVIQQKLYNRIYDTTVTIVLISKKMKDGSKEEKNQWIPREVAYSLREQTRDDRTSYTNGVLAVVLPDENGSYDYAVVKMNCGVIVWRTDTFFRIIGKNMFNKIEKNSRFCLECTGEHHHNSDHSFIHPVKWDDFITDHNLYINHVLDLKDRLHEFDIKKTHD